jgi:tetratricopeptide (TPR) repeat protein
MFVSGLWLALSLSAAAQLAPPAPPAPLAPVAPLPPDFPDFDAIFSDIGPRVDAAMAKANALSLAIPKAFPLFQTGVGVGVGFGRGMRDDSGSYDSATRLLDERRYDDAIARFDRIIAAKTDRADRSLYWKAYALNRLGRRDDALAAIAQLRKDYPQSRWLNDAQALEVEVRQGSGQPVSPDTEANEDLKLMAINGLMSADPERALPLLEGLLKGNTAPRLKDRALFVITQSNSPRAKQILADYAKGAGNPDLQARAIRYVGMTASAESQQQLTSIYSSTSDPEVKREVIRALMTGRARDPLFNLAKTEKDTELRAEAIRQLGAMRASDQLAQLYASESDQKVKENIIRSLRSANDAKAMVDIARKETNPELKKAIVSNLSTMKSKEATDYLMELLK